MIQIGRHIEILLLSNDCVIVPGLGGFVTHKVNARYDEDDCIFLPPIRTLGFNPQLQLNDSLLAISYVEAFDISYPEALRMIETEVEELKQRLNTEGNYEINGIGNLYLNKEGAVAFEPCEAGVLTPDLYALSSFDFVRLPIIPQSAVVSDTTDNNETAPTINNIIEENKPAETVAPADTDSDNEDSDYIHINTTWLKAAVAAAAVLLIAIVMISPNETVRGYYSHMSTWSTGMIMKLIPKDTNTETVKIPQKKIKVVMKKAKTVQPPVTAPQTTAKATKETPKAEIAPVENCYTIVLASSITKNNAKHLIQTLKTKGYNDAMLYDNGNIIRVVYGNFATEQNAVDSLRKLRDSRDFEDAWVLKF